MRPMGGSTALPPELVDTDVGAIAASVSGAASYLSKHTCSDWNMDVHTSGSLSLEW